jgi:hypothetical protein
MRRTQLSGDSAENWQNTHERCHVFHTDNENHQRHQVVRHDRFPIRIPIRGIPPAESQKRHDAETHHRRAQHLDDAREGDTEPGMHGGRAREEEEEV